jgi:hypothetical protein
MESDFIVTTYNTFIFCSETWTRFIVTFRTYDRFAKRTRTWTRKSISGFSSQTFMESYITICTDSTTSIIYNYRNLFLTIRTLHFFFIFKSFSFILIIFLYYLCYDVGISGVASHARRSNK